MVGYYLFTGLIYLPVLERRMQADALRETLEQVSARLQPLFGGALVAFLVTGTYLMLINKSYLGLGHFFSNPWSSLIVIKHGLVLAFLALAVYSERANLPRISADNPRPLQQFRRALYVNLILGVIILLLTAIAQAG
jgi:putative copper export protein